MTVVQKVNSFSSRCLNPLLCLVPLIFLFFYFYFFAAFFSELYETSVCECSQPFGSREAADNRTPGVIHVASVRHSYHYGILTFLSLWHYFHVIFFRCLSPLLLYFSFGKLSSF